MTEKKGQIRVTVQEADRLEAITQLSEAIVYLAKALNATPQVTVSHCYIQADGGPGLVIDTSPDTRETIIREVDGLSEPSPEEGQQ